MVNKKLLKALRERNNQTVLYASVKLLTIAIGQLMELGVANNTIAYLKAGLEALSLELDGVDKVMNQEKTNSEFTKIMKKNFPKGGKNGKSKK